MVTVLAVILFDAVNVSDFVEPCSLTHLCYSFRML